MAAREAYSRRGSAGPCLGPADESSSARSSRALRGTAVEGAVPPQMGPYHRSSLLCSGGKGDRHEPLRVDQRSRRRHAAEGRRLVLATRSRQWPRRPQALPGEHALRRPQHGLSDRGSGVAHSRALPRRPDRIAGVLPRHRARGGRRRQPRPGPGHRVLPRLRRQARDLQRQRRRPGDALGGLAARPRALLRGHRPPAPRGRAWPPPRSSGLRTSSPSSAPWG